MRKGNDQLAVPVGPYLVLYRENEDYPPLAHDHLVDLLEDVEQLLDQVFVNDVRRQEVSMIISNVRLYYTFDDAKIFSMSGSLYLLDGHRRELGKKFQDQYKLALQGLAPKLPDEELAVSIRAEVRGYFETLLRDIPSRRRPST